MPHESELSYSERVGNKLREIYGEDNVEEQYVLEDSDRRVDFWVDTGLVILAIEVENDWEAAIKGVGQTTLYSCHHELAMPLVILPPGHFEQPEIDMLRVGFPIVEMDV